jgi:hypothetical protein
MKQRRYEPKLTSLRLRLDTIFIQCFNSRVSCGRSAVEGEALARRNHSLCRSEKSLAKITHEVPSTRLINDDRGCDRELMARQCGSCHTCTLMTYARK